MHATFKHHCPCSEDVFWNEIAGSEEFARRLFIDELGFQSWEVQSSHRLESELRRVVVAVPRIDERIPKAFLRYLRRGLAFRETDVFDSDKRTALATITPSSASRRISIQIRLGTEPRGDRACECIFDIDVKASLFTALGGSSSYGIGGIVEQDILARLLEGCEVRAALTRRYLEEKGLLGK